MNSEIYQFLIDFTIIPTEQFPKNAPKPVVSPYGPGYSLHPELSRRYAPILARSVAAIVLPLTITSLLIASGTTAIAEEGGSPSSLFTGQPGVGSWMDQFV